MRYFINETFIAELSQQVFSLHKPFKQQIIDVYKNGSLLSHKVDYEVQEAAGCILLNEPALNGDVINVRSNVSLDNMQLQVVSDSRKDRADVLYKKWGTASKLMMNNKYEFSIGIGKEVFKFHFGSRLSPLFSSARAILEDIGEFIEGFTEEYIYSKIHANSEELIELLDELANRESNPVENVAYEIDSDGIYKLSNKTGERWVKSKTEIELILARYYGISYSYGSISKSLGDISIEKSTKLPYIDQLLKRLEKDFAAADEYIRGVNSVATFVKGSVNHEFTERTIRF